MPKFFDEISPNDQKIGENFYDEINDEGSKEIPNELPMVDAFEKRSQIKKGNTYDIPLVY